MRSDLAGLPLQAFRQRELMGRQHTRCRPVSRGRPVGSFIDSRLPRSSMGPPLPSVVGNSQAQPHTARPVTWPTIRARGPSPGVTLDRVAMRPTVPQEEASAPVASAAGDIGSRGRPATGRGASRILSRSDGPSTCGPCWGRMERAGVPPRPLFMFGLAVLCLILPGLGPGAGDRQERSLARSLAEGAAVSAWVENRGQWREGVEFAWGQGATRAWVGSGGLWIERRVIVGEERSELRGHVVRMRVEAGSLAGVRGTVRASGERSFLRGSDPRGWQLGLPRRAR